MRKLEWLVLVLLALGGIVYVISYVERFEPLARFGPIPSAAFYEGVARKAALEFGVDVSGWTVTSTAGRNDRLRLAWERDLVTRPWLLRTPYTVDMEFYGPNRQLCEVTVDYTGIPLAFSQSIRGETSRTTPPSPPDAATVQRAREVAIATFRSRLRPPPEGEAVDLGFRLTADAVVEGRDIEFEWTSDPDPGGMLAWQVEVRVRDGAVHRFALSPLVLDRLRDREREFDKVGEPVLFVVISVGVAGLIWAGIVTILNLYRKRLPWSFALRASAAAGVLLLFHVTLGTGLRNQPPDWYMDLNRAVIVLFGLAFNFAIGLALLCAGRSSRAVSDLRRWLGVEDFLQLRWANASVARSFWTAGLISLLWVSLPYVASLPFRDVLFDGTNRLALGLRIPFVDSLTSVTTLAILFAIAFCFPYVKAHVPWRPLRFAAALFLGAAAATVISVADFSLQAGAATAVGYGLLMVYSYARFGVLASVLAGVVSVPVGRAIFLSAAGDITMQSWGVGFLAFFSLGIAVALVLDARNPERELEQTFSEEELALFAQESQRDVVSRREQLLGEFALAQQAQQRMLPHRPPYVEGFDISAVCRPAQQVGGDLYDYIRLSDGRWACCVADVSGKGVSAALYMTMTKGLLNALRLERGDLMEIATVLNQRLYEVIRRRSFVTMSLAAVDPATRSLEVLRAGHLPLLHMSLEGEVHFVESKGMGLGLAPSAVFCRNLTAATVQMKPGDVAVLYSDGVTEAMNPDREEFGEERFAQVVATARDRRAIEIRDLVMEEIARFQQGAPVHDDITVVVVKALDPAADPP